MIPVEPASSCLNVPVYGDNMSCANSQLGWTAIMVSSEAFISREAFIFCYSPRCIAPFLASRYSLLAYGFPVSESAASSLMPKRK